MKILKIINALIIMLNASFIFFNNNFNKGIIYDKPLVFSEDRFYQLPNPSDVPESSEQQFDWKQTYLHVNNVDSINEALVEGMEFNGEELKNFTHFDPTQTNWNNAGQRDYEMYAIVNGVYQNDPWNQIKNTISEGDEIIFLKKYKQDTYLDGVYQNTNNYYCKVKETNFHFSNGYSWLIELKIPTKGQNELKSIWKPIYVPNTKLFCDKNESKSTEWAMYLNKEALEVDLTRDFQLGKMFFLNNQFIDATGYIDLISNKKPYIEDQFIRIPYKIGDKIEIDNLRTSGNYKIKKIHNPRAVYKNWSFGKGIYIKPYIANGFIKYAEFSNKKLSVDETDDNLIVRNILKSNNYFGFNVFSNNFKEIKVDWGQKRQNNEIQPLTITMKDQKTIKNYNFEISYKNIINQNLRKEKELQKQQEIIAAEKQKQTKKTEKINKEKEAFKQNFTIYKEGLESNFYQNSNSILVKNMLKNEIKSKKTFFSWLAAGIVFISIFLFFKEKK